MLFRSTSDEMLLLGLEKGSEKLPFFSGCHVYPVFPGEGARSGAITLPESMVALDHGRQWAVLARSGMLGLG